MQFERHRKKILGSGGGSTCYFDFLILVTNHQALRRLLNVERRLLQNPSLYEVYKKVILCYPEQGHMYRIVEMQLPQNISRFFIIRRLTITASLLITKLFSTSLPFSLHSFILTTDIQQIYRQILIASNHQDYDRIIFGFFPYGEIQDFSHCHIVCVVGTVLGSCTTGISLQTLTLSFKNPLSTSEEGQSLQHEQIKLLEKGGFHLQKWTSNSPKLLSDIQKDHCRIDPLSINSSGDHTPKVLSIQ